MRTTKGSARNRAKKRLFRKAKGYRGGRSKLLRTVKETLVRSGAFAYRDRRTRRRQFRKLWIIRINAAVRQRGIRYSEFIFGLNQAKMIDFSESQSAFKIEGGNHTAKKASKTKRRQPRKATVAS